jgi:hypothetical protein
MKYNAILIIILICCQALHGQVKILFDATKAEAAGNADWVIDADLHNLGYSTGPAVVGGGNESNPQRYPTPDQSTVTSSTPETYWQGGLSAWGIELVKQGYLVETLPYNGQITYGNSGNVQDLSNYKVFIVCEPNILFTTAEKTALMLFIQNGGGLFMVCDHTNSDRNNDGYDSPEIWDDFISNNGVLSNPFGITFDYVDISQTTTNIPSLPGDPLLHGIMGDVTQAKWSNGTTMTLDPTVNSSVKGVVYKTGSSFGNSNAMVAYATYGSGRVVGFGDSSPADDGTGDPNDNLYTGWTGDANGNHRILMTNATIWLASSPTPPSGLATVTTTAVSSITMTGAVSGGNVTADGGNAVTARGVCWSTSASPGVAGNHTADGSGTGAFTSTLTGLTANTAYHVRAYATNSTGTAYGPDIQFSTSCGSYALPFSETFTTTTLPTCWSQADHQGNGEIWAFGAISPTPSPAPSMTGNYAYVNSDGYGSGNSQNADLITPTLDLSAYASVTLQFTHYFKSYSGSSGTVSYSLDNGTTWSQIQQFTGTTSNPATFSQAISAAAGHSQVKFKWNYTGTYGYYWCIDNVQVTGVQNKTLNLTLFTEGLYNPATGLLNKVQDCTDGESSFNKFSGTVADTLSILLANASSPWAYTYQAHAITVSTAGTVSLPIPAAFASSYYIVIRHRNSIETWSSSPVSFSGTTITYNFSSAAGQAFGSNLKQVTGTFPAFTIYSGDVASSGTGQDGYIDIFDNAGIFNHSQAGSFGYSPEDLNGDGFVDIFDVVIVFNNLQNGAGMNTPPNPN